MKLDISQLTSLAASAGFSGADLATAVAVALAESGGDPQAYNPEVHAGAAQGYGSFGLWQIYLQAHPEFSGLNLFDPQANASAAFSVYSRAGGFSPWATYKEGTYLAFIGSVQQAIASSGRPSSDAVVVADGSMPDVGGVDPGGSSLFAMLVVGGLLLWAGIEIFG